MRQLSLFGDRKKLPGLRPARLDRILVLWIAGLQIVWIGCLPMLWSRALDTSGATHLLTLAAMALAVRLAAPLPGRIARGLQRLMSLLGVQDVLRMELATAGGVAGGEAESRTLQRMLGGMAAVAALCLAVSTAAAVAAEPACRWLTGRFLWSPASWRVASFLLQLAAFLPMGLGLSLTFLAGALVRGGSGRDIYASSFRDWLWAAAAALAALALLWVLGAEWLGASGVAAVLLLGTGVGLFARREVTVRPRRTVHPISTGPQRRRRVGIAAGFAVAALLLLVQMRMWADLASVGPAGTWWWASGSLVLLAVMLRHVDHKSHPPGALQAIGVCVGAPAGALAQAALALQAASAWAGGDLLGAWLLAGMAVGAQLPLAALGAILLSRQRRTFAIAGGRARAYVGSVAAGLALGVLAYVAAGMLPGGEVLLAGAGLAVLAGAAAAGIIHSRRLGGQLRWAGCGSALIVATALVLLLAVRAAKEQFGIARPGVWLTGLRATADRPPVVASSGGLSAYMQPRHQAVSEALAQLMRRHGGRWWVVASSAEDLPAEGMPAAVTGVWSAPDPSAVPSLGRAGLLADRRAGHLLLSQVDAGGETFDAVLLAPVPAGHPQAWRCYRSGALRRAASRLNSGGVLAIRTQAPARSKGKIALVVAAVRALAGSCWVAWTETDQTLDVLITAPARTPSPAAGGELKVASGAEFLERFGARLASPGDR